MGTPITDFIDPVRVWLGDHDDTIRMYSDDSIERGVRVAIKGGDLEDYSLSVDLTEITPAITDANVYMLLAAKVARRFVGALPSSQSAATRAFRESIGSFRGLCVDLDDAIDRAEGGNLFDGWDTCYCWISSICGSCTVSTRYTHHEPSATLVWTVNHELGRNPIFKVCDLNMNVVTLYDAVYTTQDVLTITFMSPQSGFVYCT